MVGGSNDQHLNVIRSLIINEKKQGSLYRICHAIILHENMKQSSKLHQSYGRLYTVVLFIHQTVSFSCSQTECEKAHFPNSKLLVFTFHGRLKNKKNNLCHYLGTLFLSQVQNETEFSFI